MWTSFMFLFFPQQREFNSMQDRVMLLADSSEDEFWTELQCPCESPWLCKRGRGRKTNKQTNRTNNFLLHRCSPPPRATEQWSVPPSETACSALRVPPSDVCFDTVVRFHIRTRCLIQIHSASCYSWSWYIWMILFFLLSWCAVFGPGWQ